MYMTVFWTALGIDTAHGADMFDFRYSVPFKCIVVPNGAPTACGNEASSELAKSPLYIFAP